MCRRHCFCLPRAGLGHEQKYKSGFLLTRGRYDDKGFTRISIFGRARQLPTTSKLLVKIRPKPRKVGRNVLPGHVGRNSGGGYDHFSPPSTQPPSVTTQQEKAKKPSVFRNRKRTFEHRRLVKLWVLFPDSVSRLFPPSQSPQPFDVPRGLRSKSRDLGE